MVSSGQKSGEKLGQTNVQWKFLIILAADESMQPAAEWI